MQSSEAIIGLVADGYASDPQPWVATDLVVVGPANDPAGIKGATGASAAIKKIIESRSPFVIHGSGDADQIVRGIVQSERLSADPESSIILLNDHQRQVLQIAVDQKAYTLISRVPFRTGKLAAAGMEVMVEGDPVLCRPFVLATANPEKIAGVHRFEARRLAMFLRSPETQEWIAAFGAGKAGDRPPFIAVSKGYAHSEGDKKPLLVVREEGAANPLAFDAKSFAALPREEVRVKDHSGKERVYEGPLVRALLERAGAPIGNHQVRGPNLSLYLTVEAADGHKAVFSLAEFDSDFAERSILLADRCDGEPLDGGEGPLRLIVPQEARPARWIKRVVAIRIERD
jgi:ABC-type tungstate transport system permease subunit